jgi:hypothetical protein
MQLNIVENLGDKMAEFVDTMRDFVGKVDSKVYEEFVSLQNTAASLIQRIGFVEFQKHELMKLLESSNAKANDLMKYEAKRLGVPEGSDWHITKDGEAYLGKAPENTP